MVILGWVYDLEGTETGSSQSSVIWSTIAQPLFESSRLFIKHILLSYSEKRSTSRKKVKTNISPKSPKKEIEAWKR